MRSLAMHMNAHYDNNIYIRYLLGIMSCAKDRFYILLLYFIRQTRDANICCHCFSGAWRIVRFVRRLQYNVSRLFLTNGILFSGRRYYIFQADTVHTINLQKTSRVNPLKFLRVPSNRSSKTLISSVHDMIRRVSVYCSINITDDYYLNVPLL